MEIREQVEPESSWITTRDENRNHRSLSKEDEGFYLQISRHDPGSPPRMKTGITDAEAGRRHSHTEAVRKRRGAMGARKKEPKQDEGFYLQIRNSESSSRHDP